MGVKICFVSEYKGELLDISVNNWYSEALLSVKSFKLVLTTNLTVYLHVGLSFSLNIFSFYCGPTVSPYEGLFTLGKNLSALIKSERKKKNNHLIYLYINLKSSCLSALFVRPVGRFLCFFLFLLFFFVSYNLGFIHVYCFIHH